VRPRRSRSAFSSFDWTRNIVAAEDRPLRRRACSDDSDNGSNGDESAVTHYGGDSDDSENGSDGSGSNDSFNRAVLGTISTRF